MTPKIGVCDDTIQSESDFLKIEKNRNNHNSEQVSTDVMQPHYVSPTVINLSKH